MPENLLSWTRCRGRNGWDEPQDVAPDMGTEALNVHFTDGGLGTKRGGCISTGHTTTGISGGYNALFGGYIPGQDETAREMFVVDNAATNTIRRFAASSTISASLTLPNNIAADDTVISFAPLNGKLYIAYNGTTNRVKVFDPGLSTTTIRYAGLADAAAPSVANTGAGTYAATLRYYKVAYTEQRASVTVRRGELSSATSFTPSGTGTHARITKPAALSEGETHWEVYGSTDGVIFYGPLATTVVGTTTYDDNSTPADWPDDFDAAPVTGENLPMPSVKFLYSNGVRLFGLGVWETSAGDSHTPQAGTVYFTPALDSSGIHDDERVRSTVSAVGRVILGRNSGGVDRGIAGLGNAIYAFQSRGIYSLLPTENSDVPFRRVQVSSRLGATSHQSIKEAVDQLGRPALYFLDPEWGLYRIGASGIQFCGRDVYDLWQTVNHGAANVVAWAEYLPSITMLVIGFASVAADDPDTIMAFDVTEGWPDENGDVRGGWAQWTGTIATARCATMMSATMGASMSRPLTLYIGPGASTTLRKYSESALDDNGTDFQAYVQSRAFSPEPLVNNKELAKGYLLSKAVSAVTVRQTLIRNFGDETSRTSDALLTAAGSETKVLAEFEDSALAEMYAFQVRLGDSAAQEGQWTFDRWYVQATVKEAR